MMEQIRQMKRKQKTLATNILKSTRREAIKALLRDEKKRRRIKVHAMSLVERRKNLQSRILEEEDFKPLLEAFPCWCVTTYAVSDSLPLKPGMFDVAVIDEALNVILQVVSQLCIGRKRRLSLVMTNNYRTFHS